MLCRQVIPDTNGIEQIYIVKSENEPENREVSDSLGTSALDNEEVDHIKQEPPSDEEEACEDGIPSFGMLDVIIKEELEEPGLEDGGETSTKSRKDSNNSNVSMDGSARSSSESDSSYTNSDESDDEVIRHTRSRKDTRRTKNVRSIQDTEDSMDESLNVSKKRGPYKKKEQPTDKIKAVRRKVIKRFVCHCCPKKFSTLFNLERHEKSHITQAEKQKHKKKNLCFVCQQENETKDALHEHLCLHADMLPYMCPDCEKPVKVISVRLLNKHFQLHKEMHTGIIKCVYCSARFHSLSGCRQHERGHVEGQHIKEAQARADLESKRLNVKVIIVDGLKRYECEYCGKSYSLLATLRRHTNSHTMEKVYMCKMCGKIFNKASSLTLHEKVHSDVKPYKCETCGKGFKETIRLIEHRRIHTGEKPYQCHCGMAFRKKYILKEHKHICDLPEDIKTCECRFCQQSFPSYLDMVHHIRQLHTLGMPETKCQYCTSKFKNVIQLIIHEQRHDLPNVIKCDQCNRIFKQEANLEAHIKTHINEPEAFICDVCGKTFNQSVNLRIHKRIHNATRSHVCDLCPKSFLCSSTMRRHRLTHFNGNSKNYIPTLEDEETEPGTSQIECVKQKPQASTVHNDNM
ncbi:zinc finger protein ZFP2-like [Malaya genurostris]|uniref:zinc finger protein ZFP2-like n=1 Tax=Malaya genurostris TaxID=325434 RepID=UPI0026F3BD5B|nr:zinc finger protein ZFP2-like [Malaya genurostris]